jgi:hypothetical protein
MLPSWWFGHEPVQVPRQPSGTPDASTRDIGLGPREDADMPEGLSKKRERQYEHIKESYRDRGVSTDEAEERAARTVNKQRRQKGETKDQRKS